MATAVVRRGRQHLTIISYSAILQKQKKKKKKKKVLRSNSRRAAKEGVEGVSDRCADAAAAGYRPFLNSVKTNKCLSSEDTSTRNRSGEIAAILSRRPADLYKRRAARARDALDPRCRMRRPLKIISAKRKGCFRREDSRVYRILERERAIMSRTL